MVAFELSSGGSAKASLSWRRPNAVANTLSMPHAGDKHDARKLFSLGWSGVSYPSVVACDYP
jgi:hypothetical protein